ncbi:MAG UNVERIFIED_CONTAM: hypothetical protein LVQ98_05955 [Rickettsiaceae bacterium]|jgi:acyl-[acyl-carrier-protein]-phospholipid O-acyltransferase/long-chain-fatty-acid--[acyl-carrier-protein] ligase
MVSLSAIEEVVTYLDKEASHAAMHILDKVKGEQILLFTTSNIVNRDSMLEALRLKNMTELYLPKYFVNVGEIPVLATGKTNYRALLAMAEEYVKSIKKD